MNDKLIKKTELREGWQFSDIESSQADICNWLLIKSKNSTETLQFAMNELNSNVIEKKTEVE